MTLMFSNKNLRRIHKKRYNSTHILVVTVITWSISVKYAEHGKNIVGIQHT